MALSSVTYSGNGSTTSFAIPFPYLFQSDVSATVNGVTTTFTWTNPALIHFATAPINGSAVFIVRKTNITTLDVVFTDGSTVQASDINTAELQSLYLAQEANDGVSVAIAAAATATAATGAANAAAAAANAAVAGLVPFTGDTGTGGVRGLVPAPPAGSAVANKVLGAGGSWVSQATGVGVNIVTAGADPTGVVDATTIIQSVLTAIGSTGGLVVIPPGIYKTSAPLNLTVATLKSVTLQGYGADVSVIGVTTGNLLNVALATAFSSIHIRDLTLTTSANNVGTAITINETAQNVDPANSAYNDITNVTIRGSDGYAAAHVFAIGVLVNGGVSNVVFTNLFVTGSGSITGAGVQVQGDLVRSSYGTAFAFINCTFNFLQAGIQYCSWVQGVMVAQCQFTGCNLGVVIPASQLGSLVELAVTNCQFNCQIIAIEFGTIVNTVNISNNMISVDANNGICLNGIMGLASITGNSFTGSGFTGINGVVSNSGSTGVMVSGNSFFSMVTGVNIQTGTNSANVQSNIYVGVTNKTLGTASATIVFGGGSV